MLELWQNKTDNTDSQTGSGTKSGPRYKFSTHKLQVDGHLQHLLTANNLSPEITKENKAKSIVTFLFFKFSFWIPEKRRQFSNKMKSLYK